MSTAAPPPARAHAMSSPLKIASWNINSVRARLDIVEKFLTDEMPDILCLQETKVVDGDFPKGVFRRLGYNRSEEHTSELQSLMRISYAVFCLKKKTKEL